MKIKEKVLKENLKHDQKPVDFFIWAYEMKELQDLDLEYDLGLLIDKTFAEVGKVIDEIKPTKVYEWTVRDFKEELKKELGI